jgi:hypothetical protein
MSFNNSDISNKLFGYIYMSVIEEEVSRKLIQRAEFGLKKYGVTLLREDLTTLDWLTHAQEEAMDLANYLEVLIQREIKRVEENNYIINLPENIE